MHINILMYVYIYHVHISKCIYIHTYICIHIQRDRERERERQRERERKREGRFSEIWLFGSPNPQKNDWHSDIPLSRSEVLRRSTCYQQTLVGHGASG